MLLPTPQRKSSRTRAALLNPLKLICNILTLQFIIWHALFYLLGERDEKESKGDNEKYT